MYSSSEIFWEITCPMLEDYAQLGQKLVGGIMNYASYTSCIFKNFVCVNARPPPAGGERSTQNTNQHIMHQID